MDGIVGILALTTLGIVALGAGLFYLRSLREGRNRDAAKNVFAEDGSSATTAVRGGSAPDHLKQVPPPRDWPEFVVVGFLVVTGAIMVGSLLKTYLF